MTAGAMADTPERCAYDVVIVGGAIMAGANCTKAWSKTQSLVTR